MLTYNLQSKDPNGFSLKYNHHDEKIAKGSKIILIIPHFDLYITGDLSFYADILGMPKSSSYWCPWCLLSRPEWQQSANNNGEKRTIEFLNEMYHKIVKDKAKRLQPVDKKGVSTPIHYKGLTIDNLVQPLLHMEMGMVNQVWDDLEDWFDENVGVIPSDEISAGNELADAKERLDVAHNNKEEAKKP